MIYSINTVAIPPGATIREQLEIRGMNQKEFAVRMGLSEKHISHLINGKVELTYDVALRLESVLGLPARFWNRLEALYREQEARVYEELNIKKDKDIAKKIPYSKGANLGWLEKTKINSEKIHNLRQYFEVASLSNLQHIDYSEAKIDEEIDYEKMMWIQKAKIEARSIKTSQINIELLLDLLPQIRTLTREESFVFCKELKELLSQCGIALVLLENLDDSFTYSMSFIDGKHIVLGLSINGQYVDTFWFNLFHELGHIILGHSKSDLNEEQEEEANSFANNTLIPFNEFEVFSKNNEFSIKSIEDFAEKIGIDEGIVLGRLQKENYIRVNQFSKLKKKYTISTT